MTSQSHMNQGPEDEREQEARKIVQISGGQCVDQYGNAYELNYGFDEHTNECTKYWEKLPPLPES